MASRTPTSNFPLALAEAPPHRSVVLTMSILRMFAGASAWASPAHAWKLFGLGPMNRTDSSSIISRLFGVRDFALGMAVLHPNPDIRRIALQAGVVIDAADIAANVLAVRTGAPKSSLLGVAAGAGLFVALGLAGLKES